MATTCQEKRKKKVITNEDTMKNLKKKTEAKELFWRTTTRTASWEATNNFTDPAGPFVCVYIYTHSFLWANTIYIGFIDCVSLRAKWEGSTLSMERS